MSKKHPTAVEQAQLELRCPKCEADPGQWCKRIVKHFGKYVEFEMVAENPQKDLHTDRFIAAIHAGKLPLP